MLLRNNSYDVGYRKRHLASQKQGDHGLGLEHVQEIVKRYYGHFTIDIQDGVFETRILIPLEK